MEDSLLSRAFHVEEISDDFDPTVPPSTGHEYLQHVMYEASKCAQVVVANIDQSKFENSVNMNVESYKEAKNRALAPSVEWQHLQVAMFSDLRKKVEFAKQSRQLKPISLPKSQNEEVWFKIFFGDEKDRLEPSLTVLLSMNETLLGCLLEYHLEWLEDGLRPNQGKWLFALLACLSLPLTSVTCSVLRDLARECARIRAEDSLNEKNVNALNLIICLVARYFGQIDLAD